MSAESEDWDLELKLGDDVKIDFPNFERAQLIRAIGFVLLNFRTGRITVKCSNARAQPEETGREILHPRYGRRQFLAYLRGYHVEE